MKRVPLFSALLALVCTLTAGLFVPQTADAATPIRLWHAYRADEEKALAAILALAHGIPVEAVSIPYDAYGSKLASAIPLGEGPDLFIDSHERLGDYRARRIVAPVGDALDASAFVETALRAVQDGGVAWAVPLSQKCAALYINTSLVPVAPPDLETIASLAGRMPPGVFPLAWEMESAYGLSPLLAAFDVGLLDTKDEFAFVGERAEAALEFTRSLRDQHVVPENADGALVTQLFGAGQAAFAISGPWLAASLGAKPGLHYRVTTLPVVRATGRADAAVSHGRVGDALPQRRRAAQTSAPSPVSSQAGGRAHPRPVRAPPLGPRGTSRPHEPRHAGLRRAGSHAESPCLRPSAGAPYGSPQLAPSARCSAAMPPPPTLSSKPTDASTTYAAPSGPRLPGAGPPGARRPRPLWGLSLDEPRPRSRLSARASAFGPRVSLRRPAVLALAVLVLVPLVVGAVTSLFAGTREARHYVGLQNFIAILTNHGGSLFASGSFYLVLLVTCLWTICNIVLHVVIGVTLALLLVAAHPALPAHLRVLLIVPWAVPSYVTALAWKGMFHRQFGAVTALTLALGHVLGVTSSPSIGSRKFSTAFTANLATNVWLGFPFMMVVTLGALTAVPDDVLEAAKVDGATRFQRLRLVTLPSSVPPDARGQLGAIWTFNMFNVVFLVSGGDPDGTTDILVSEAYRWAFTRENQYGYAAAYAVLIFLLLFTTPCLGRLSATRRAKAGHVTLLRLAGAAELLESMATHLVLVARGRLRPLSGALGGCPRLLRAAGPSCRASSPGPTRHPEAPYGGRRDDARQPGQAGSSATSSPTRSSSRSRPRRSASSSPSPRRTRWRAFDSSARSAGMRGLLATQMSHRRERHPPLLAPRRARACSTRGTGLVIGYASTGPLRHLPASRRLRAIPVDLEEAAMVDGATRVGAFFRVVLPAARPAIAVTALFAFMSAYNEFILAATLLDREEMYTLPVVLQRYIGEYRRSGSPSRRGPSSCRSP